MYSVVVGLLVLGIWLYTEISVRRPQRALGKQFIWHCTICGFTYLDDEAQNLSECPQCGTLISIADQGVREGQRPPPAPVVPPEKDKSEERAGGSKRKRPHARRRGPRRRR